MLLRERQWFCLVGEWSQSVLAVRDVLKFLKSFKKEVGASQKM